MKKILIYIPLVVVTGLIGCDKELNLKNPQAIDAAGAFSTGEKVEKVLIGNYATMGSQSLFGGNAFWMSELMASDGELNWVGTFAEPKQIWGKNILSNNGYVSGLYIAAYSAIFNANNIIANAAIVDASDQARVIAEAKFQRAMAYFELIKYFGEKPYFAGNAASLKGVPLITSPGPSAPQDVFYLLPRASVEEVYQQIIADFKYAETNLPATNGFYANKPSASLALARVYLQQEKFADARDAADRCISVATANGFSLVSAYANAFNNDANTSEDLFAMQVTDQSGANSCFTFFSTAPYGARDGDIEITDKHYNKYDPSDQRRSLFFYELGSWRCGKWRDIYKNVKVMRLAEAYLTRAEGNLRLGTAVGATPDQDVNQTVTRAGLTALTGVTLDQILHERELELSFEGQGLWDAKRLRQTVDGKAWNDDKLTFPIPLREININPSLEQNSGY